MTENWDIYYAYPELPASVKKEYMSSSGYVQLPARDQYVKLLNDKENKYVDLGDFYGFFSIDAYKYISDTWLTYGEKFQLKNGSTVKDNENLIWSIAYAASQVKTPGKNHRLLWVSMIISSLLAFVLIYI